MTDVDDVTFYSLANRNHVMKNKPSWSSSLFISLRETSSFVVVVFGLFVCFLLFCSFILAFFWGGGGGGEGGGVLLGENKILINLSELVTVILPRILFITVEDRSVAVVHQRAMLYSGY